MQDLAYSPMLPQFGIRDRSPSPSPKMKTFIGQIAKAKDYLGAYNPTVPSQQNGPTEVSNIVHTVLKQNQTHQQESGNSPVAGLDFKKLPSLSTVKHYVYQAFNIIRRSPSPSRSPSFKPVPVPNSPTVQPDPVVLLAPNKNLRSVNINGRTEPLRPSAERVAIAIMNAPSQKLSGPDLMLAAGGTTPWASTVMGNINQSLDKSGASFRLKKTPSKNFTFDYPKGTPTQS
jgi:hypothetical protein